MPNKTTVTHPDGTVSKRTSKNGHYTHAVVVETAWTDLAVRAAANEAAYRKSAANYAAAAQVQEFEIEDRNWTRGEVYRAYILGGVFVDSGVVGRNLTVPTLAEGQAKMADLAAKYTESADAEAAKVAEYAAQSGVASYGVLRWSSRADLAEKAANGEFSRLASHGTRVYVVTVD